MVGRVRAVIGTLDAPLLVDEEVSWKLLEVAVVNAPSLAVNV